ncbi:MAG TPA: hypothetical protein VHR41_05785 [Gemmatimonadales bacterium]|nr:hypothetical protein [Gemmatimonadales bacterium]
MAPVEVGCGRQRWLADETLHGIADSAGGLLDIPRLDYLHTAHVLGSLRQDSCSAMAEHDDRYASRHGLSECDPAFLP